MYQYPFFLFSIRSPGSAALHICAVASGSLDAYYEFGPHIWDFAAAQLIALEAGAVITSPNGNVYLINYGINCS